MCVKRVCVLSGLVLELITADDRTCNLSGWSLVSIYV